MCFLSLLLCRYFDLLLFVATVLMRKVSEKPTSTSHVTFTAQPLTSPVLYSLIRTTPKKSSSASVFPSSPSIRRVRMLRVKSAQQASRVLSTPVKRFGKKNWARLRLMWLILLRILRRCFTLRCIARLWHLWASTPFDHSWFAHFVIQNNATGETQGAFANTTSPYFDSLYCRSVATK